MRVFGSPCHVYKQEKSKLDARTNPGIFVGYDRDSPAYLVYFPETACVKRHRLVKFSSIRSEQSTQTIKPNDYVVHPDKPSESTDSTPGTETVDKPEQSSQTNIEPRYPKTVNIKLQST